MCNGRIMNSSTPYDPITGTSQMTAPFKQDRLQHWDTKALLLFSSTFRLLCPSLMGKNDFERSWGPKHCHYRSGSHNHWLTGTWTLGNVRHCEWWTLWNHAYSAPSVTLMSQTADAVTSNFSCKNLQKQKPTHNTGCSQRRKQAPSFIP